MESQLSRKEAFWALNGLPAIGPITLNRLLDHFDGDPRLAFSASAETLRGVPGLGKRAREVLLEWESRFDLKKEMAQAESRHVGFVTRDDDDYPPLLREISDPPIGLYRIGNYDFGKPAVAIVGTRHCTLYGQSVARSLARDLAKRGFCVVSGMARGIDTCAHKGALEAASGSTVCVLGNGIDIVYPPENIDLYKAVSPHGAIVSEFPFGRRADRQTFPMRNRVVSGMCHAVVVVESDAAGGSMITARFAGEQGRLICAVPGRIDQKSSRGCHQLIRDGAMLLTGVDALLEELEYLRLTPSFELEPASQKAGPELNEIESKIVDSLSGGEARATEEIAEAIQLSMAEVSATVMMLELKAVVAKRLDGKYELALQVS